MGGVSWEFWEAEVVKATLISDPAHDAGCSEGARQPINGGARSVVHENKKASQRRPIAPSSLARS